MAILSPAVRRSLSSAAFAGVVLFVFLVALLHVLDPGVAGLDHTMSEFALGSFGWMMVVAFLALGLGSLALAWVLLRGEARAPVAAVLVALWGLGLVVSAFVPTDPYGTTDATATTKGQVHNLVGGLSFLVCGVGLVVLGVRARKWAGWSGRGMVVLAFGVLGLLSVVTLFLPVQVPEGILQRVMVGCFLVGLAAAAWGLRDAAPGAVATDEDARSPQA